MSSEADRSVQSERVDVTLFFPVYNDERTVRVVTEKALTVLADVADRYEVLIIDDASPDRSGEIADELAQEYEHVRAIHHDGHGGYGAAIRTGFSNARYEWICLTDGDDEYDVFDLHKLIRLRDLYDLIITFRYVKLYSGVRVFISWVYNVLVRMLFQTRYRDISTGLRLVRKSLVDEIDLDSSSPFIGAELAIKTMLRGYRVGEVGIQTFPRVFGRGFSTTPANIRATIVDMLRTRRKIFSETYQMPLHRTRDEADTPPPAKTRDRPEDRP
jgi:glycosyltransferase involved in cell wall biosynthesis